MKYLFLITFILLCSCTNNLNLKLVAGEAAPDFSFITYNSKGESKETNLSSYKGKPVLLNFWATWCDTCKEEIPAINNIAKNFGQKINVLGVITQDSSSSALDYATGIPHNFIVAFDTSGDGAKKYGLTGVPETVLIDKNGKIVLIFENNTGAVKIEGPREWDKGSYLEQIKNLINFVAEKQQS